MGLPIGRPLPDYLFPFSICAINQIQPRNFEDSELSLISRQRSKVELPGVALFPSLTQDAVVNECIYAALQLCVVSQISPDRVHSASEHSGTQATFLPVIKSG